MSLLNLQLNISVSEEMVEALDVTAGLLGMKPGTLARQMIVEGLVARNVLRNPMADKLAAVQAKRQANGVS